MYNAALKRKLLAFSVLLLFVAVDCRADDSSQIPAVGNGNRTRQSTGIPVEDQLQTSSDAPWKRKARFQGIYMRMLHGPEAMYHGSLIDTATETGSRHAAGAVLQVNDDWELAALDRASFFALKTGSAHAARESLDLRMGRRPGQPFRPWLAVTPYINFGNATGEHVSVAAGMDRFWKNGAGIQTELFAWRPWDEGYYTIIEDGQRHGGTLSFTYPFASRLILSGRTHYERLALGTGAKSGGQYAGSRYGLNTRGYLRLLERKSALMGYGFRNDSLWNEYLVGSELGVFMNFDWQRYTVPDGFDAFCPTPKVFAQQGGIAGQYALSSHVGISAEAFMGQDPDRRLGFGELGGGNMRLTMVINPEFRIWSAYSYTKTGATIESGSGSENIISIGINYNF